MNAVDVPMVRTTSPTFTRCGDGIPMIVERSDRNGDSGFQPSSAAHKRAPPPAQINPAMRRSFVVAAQTCCESANMDQRMEETAGGSRRGMSRSTSTCGPWRNTTARGWRRCDPPNTATGGNKIAMFESGDEMFAPVRVLAQPVEPFLKPHSDE